MNLSKSFGAAHKLQLTARAMVSLTEHASNLDIITRMITLSVISLSVSVFSV